MTDSRRIVFLYLKDYVQAEVLDMIDEHRPASFSVAAVEQSAAPEVRGTAIANADYIFGYPSDLSQAELDSAENLKLLQLLSAGFEHVDLDAFAARAIPVANNGGANAPTVAEHTIMLILSVLRELPLHHNTLREGNWLGTDETFNMRELHGKTLGIVGFGKIGQQVARVSRGFNTTNFYYDAVRANPAMEAELHVKFLPLDELLARADVVTIHTALNESTEGLFNARTIALMKSSAILINTSRGRVVEEAPLVEALRTGRLSGAGLDVFERQPPTSDNPLLSLPNVVLTPHHAGVSRDTWIRRIAFGYANIQRVAAGRPAEAVVS